MSCATHDIKVIQFFGMDNQPFLYLHQNTYREMKRPLVLGKYVSGHLSTGRPPHEEKQFQVSLRIRHIPQSEGWMSLLEFFS